MNYIINKGTKHEIDIYHLENSDCNKNPSRKTSKTTSSSLYSFSNESVFKEKIEMKVGLNYGHSLPRYQKYADDFPLCFLHKLTVDLRMLYKI